MRLEASKVEQERDEEVESLSERKFWRSMSGTSSSGTSTEGFSSSGQMNWIGILGWRLIIEGLKINGVWLFPRSKLGLSSSSGDVITAISEISSSYYFLDGEEVSLARRYGNQGPLVIYISKHLSRMVLSTPLICLFYIISSNCIEGLLSFAIFQNLTNINEPFFFHKGP